MSGNDIELARAIMSLANAHLEFNQPLSTDWFDENTRTNQLAVILLTACWNDAIDWCECVIQDTQQDLNWFLSIDALKKT